MNEKYEKLFRFIVDTDKECSAELLHALKSLKANFDNALTITKNKSSFQLKRTRLMILVKLPNLANRFQKSALESRTQLL